MNNPNYKKLQAEDDGVINLLGLRVSKLERENRGLRATVSRLRKTELAVIDWLKQEVEE